MLKELIYTEHLAGAYESGLQICIRCGAVLTDHSGTVMTCDNSVLRGWPEGALLYITGSNPVQTTVVMPLANYGDGDPFNRKIIQCIQ